MVTEAARLVESIERLRAGAEMVRSGSPTARDELATVLHILVGGDGTTDGYGLLGRGLSELGLGLPETETWGAALPTHVDGQRVMLALRGSPEGGPRRALLDHLSEECLRFDIPGIEPSANWSYLDVVKKVRNKFASHVDRRPPRWLEELRFYPAGDADAVTFLLWRAAEVSLAATTRVLIAGGLDVEPYAPSNRYLGGVDLTEVLVLGEPGVHLDVRARLACEQWASGQRRAIVGALFGDQPFVFGLEGDARLSLETGSPGMSVAELATSFRLKGLPRVPRNAPCPCGSGRKFKLCHGR